MDQSFSERSFWKLLRKGDAEKFGLGKDRKAIRDSLRAIELVAGKSDFAFGRLANQKRNGYQVFTAATTADELVLRKISDNLRRALNIKPADRNEVVPQVIHLVKEAKDCTIYKFDISSFFESIKRCSLIERLKKETSVSPRTTQLLEGLFNQTQLKDAAGLPRGLSISPILAEYYLRDFERSCRQLAYCYFYTRYVDDMLFFCHGDSSSITSDLATALPPGLSLNPSKSVTLKIDSGGLLLKHLSSAASVSYLGYDIKLPTVKAGDLKISIPAKKLAKIKSRIAMSITRYIQDKDYNQLLLRIRFLTSNFKVGGSKQNGILYSGVFYNHRYIDSASAKEVFNDLDQFLQKLVYSKKGSLGRRLAPLLVNKQRRELCSHSFQKGHSQPVFRHFRNKELGEAREVWSHA